MHDYYSVVKKHTERGGNPLHNVPKATCKYLSLGLGEDVDFQGNLVDFKRLLLLTWQIGGLVTPHNSSRKQIPP